MTITYLDFDAFHDGILALVARGLAFTANAHTLTVTLTGGF